MEEEQEERDEEELKPEFEGKTTEEAYDLASELVVRGHDFSCDLLKRNLRVAGKQVVKDGKFVGDLQPMYTDDPLKDIESLYARYKHSIPSERSEAKRRKGTQFLALDFEDLTDDDMLYGERRNEAQAKLEMFVLFTALTGQLKWDDEWGTWFWRSGKDRDCVILKNWLTEKTK